MADITAKQKAACDRAVHKAGQAMVGSIGASTEMMIDRMLTFAAAHMVHISSPEQAAAAFRQCAESVESGVFDHLATKASQKH